MYPFSVSQGTRALSQCAVVFPSGDRELMLKTNRKFKNKAMSSLVHKRYTRIRNGLGQREDGPNQTPFVALPLLRSSALTESLGRTKITGEVRFILFFLTDNMLVFLFLLSESFQDSFLSCCLNIPRQCLPQPIRNARNKTSSVTRIKTEKHQPQLLLI